MEEVRRRSSVQDRTNVNFILDNTYIETAIFGLFRIDLMNYIKVKSILAKEFHIQPSEIDKMPAWEYELFMKEINQAVKEDNDRNKKEMEKAGLDKIDKMNNPGYMQSMQNKYTPKMPSIPSMPKL